MLKERACGIHAIVAVALASLLAVPPGFAQQPGGANPASRAPAPITPSPVDSLRILVLEGQGVVNDIRVPATSSPVVEVRDENGQPVESAEVKFDLPAVGPGGSFGQGQFSATTKTNAQGQATVTFTPNGEKGRFNIKVAATLGNRVGHVSITQTNALRPAGIESEKSGGLFKFKWWKVAVLAGVGVTVGILVTRGGGGSGPSVTLIPGSPTFGAP